MIFEKPFLGEIRKSFVYLTYNFTEPLLLYASAKIKKALLKIAFKDLQYLTHLREQDAKCPWSISLAPNAF